MGYETLSDTPGGLRAIESMLERRLAEAKVKVASFENEIRLVREKIARIEGSGIPPAPTESKGE